MTLRFILYQSIWVSANSIFNYTGKAWVLNANGYIFDWDLQEKDFFLLELFSFVLLPFDGYCFQMTCTGCLLESSFRTKQRLFNGNNFYFTAFIILFFVLYVQTEILVKMFLLASLIYCLRKVGSGFLWSFRKIVVIFWILSTLQHLTFYCKPFWQRWF